MWRRKSDKGMEFVPIVKQLRQSGANDDSAQTVPDKGDSFESVGREELDDVVLDFGGQAVAHLDYVGVGHVLVGAGTEEGSFGVED